MDKVSIIVPVYKVEEYLEKCIESLVKQTYENLEIILIDDGSPDNCPSICDDWAKKDKRIKVIHKKNGGASSARNDGLKEAQGKYIFFCDSDDYISNDMIEKLVSAMDKSQLVICGYNSVNGDKITPKNFSNLKNLNTQDIIQDLIHGWDLGLLCNKLYIRDLIQNDFDEKFIIREDLYFITHYLKNVEKISIVDECLYNYIQRGGSLTASTKKIDTNQIFLIHRLMIKVLNEKNFKELIPHQNAAFLKSFIILFKQFSLKKFTESDKEEFNKLLSTEDVEEALKNYKAKGLKEKIFIFLLKKRKFKILIKLIKLASWKILLFDKIKGDIFN